MKRNLMTDYRLAAHVESRGSEAAKLQQRRDEAVRQHSPSGLDYADLTDTGKAIVDAYIDLMDSLAAQA